MIGDNGGSLAQYFLSYLQSFVIFDRAYSQSVGDTVDLTQLDVFRTLSYANYFISKGNFEDAVRYSLNFNDFEAGSLNFRICFSLELCSC